MRITLLAIACCLGASGFALAGASQPAVTCSDFIRLDDGSWHVIKDTEIATGLGKTPGRILLKAGRIIERDGGSQGEKGATGRELFNAIDGKCRRDAGTVPL